MKTKDKKKKRAVPLSRAQVWPLDKQNYRLFALGLVILVLGYIFLAQGPWDSFWSRTLAPIVLVIGYCVVIPLAILHGKKGRENQDKT